MSRKEVTTLDELDALNAIECVEGYRSGKAGDPEPGGNHSLAYWHGWRMAMNDMGIIQITAAHQALVHAYVTRQKG